MNRDKGGHGRDFPEKWGGKGAIGKRRTQSRLDDGDRARHRIRCVDVTRDYPVPAAPQRTLLVIDDNKSVRDTLAYLLGEQGFGAVVAESGAQALELIAERPVDGALIDVYMPGMNGLATCRELRARAAAVGRSLPVWMMTGARTPQLAQASLEAGAVGLLGKPFSVDDLLRQLSGAPSGSGGTPPAPPLS
jgi:CheY-like chemotaxis protein